MTFCTGNRGISGAQQPLLPIFSILSLLYGDWKSWGGGRLGRESRSQSICLARTSDGAGLKNSIESAGPARRGPWQVPQHYKGSPEPPSSNP